MEPHPEAGIDCSGDVRLEEAKVANRSLNVLVAAVLVVLGAIALQPYIEHHFYAATTARAVEARGNLADFEQTSIAVFERVSPSVVQVVGRGVEQAQDGSEEP